MKLKTSHLLIWIVLIVTPFLLQVKGVLPTRDLMISQSNGWWSILTGTFLHGSYAHMAGNLVGILLGSAIIYNYYRKIYLTVILAGIIIPSTAMYLIGMNAVGISGLVFTFMWFIIFRGLISKDASRFLVGVVILIFYGSSIKTAIPMRNGGIAWQGHLVGLLVGMFLALYQRIKRP